MARGESGPVAHDIASNFGLSKVTRAQIHDPPNKTFADMSLVQSLLTIHGRRTEQIPVAYLPRYYLHGSMYRACLHCMAHDLKDFIHINDSLECPASDPNRCGVSDTCGQAQLGLASHISLLFGFDEG